MSFCTPFVSDMFLNFYSLKTVACISKTVTLLFLS